MKKRLTLDEIKDILLLKQTTTIQSYVKKGWIPKIAYDEKNMTVDAVILAKKLGVKNFNEPFVHEAAARYTLGLSPINNIFSFCQREKINIYRLGTKGGVRYLFRESDLKKYTEVKLELLTFGIEDEVRKNIAYLIAQSFLTVTKLTNNERSTMVLQRYVQGKSFKKIGEELSISTDTARQTFNKAVKKLGLVLPKIQEWIQSFGLTKYANMSPSDVADLLSSLETENKKLKIVRNKVSHESDLAKKNILETSIKDLNLSREACKDLYKANTKNFEDILGLSREKFRNMKIKSVKEILDLLKSKGFELKRS